MAFSSMICNAISLISRVVAVAPVPPPAMDGGESADAELDDGLA
jgi:hypothetical protein